MYNMTNTSTNDITKNEINNLIYMFLKFTFEIEPLNADIAFIVGKVSNNPTYDNLRDETIRLVRTKYGETVAGYDDYHAERHMKFIYDEFFKLPYDLRNQLGNDENADEFVTYH